MRLADHFREIRDRVLDKRQRAPKQAILRDERRAYDAAVAYYKEFTTEFRSQVAKYGVSSHHSTAESEQETDEGKQHFLRTIRDLLQTSGFKVKTRPVAKGFRIEAIIPNQPLDRETKDSAIKDRVAIETQALIETPAAEHVAAAHASSDVTGDENVSPK